MDRKGQITIGLILMGFISILVGLILMQGTFPFIGQTSNSFTLTNRTFTATSLTPVDLVGQELLSAAIVTNRTGQEVVSAANYDISERISRIDGLKRISFVLTPAGSAVGLNTSALNVSYTYGQEGYIDDAGGRAVTGLIPILMALAIVAAALVLGYNKGWFD